MHAMARGGDAGGRPEWSRPPDMVGGYVAGPLVIVRSDEVLLTVRQVLAYPTGIEIEVEVHARGLPSGGRRDFTDFSDHKQLQFSLRLSDGIDVAQDDDAGLRDGRGPMLVQTRAQWSSNHTDGRENAQINLWLWPLPPPGPVNITCSWPRRALEDVSFALDGDAIQPAAERAEPYWP